MNDLNNEIRKNLREVMNMYYESILQTVGQTPLVRVHRLNHDLYGNLFFKLEFFNPLGSVKDRIGKAMIEAAEQSGVLKKGMTIIEPTSGNTGISLAFVSAAKGYKVKLVMPETMSQERRTLLLLLGAELVLTPGGLGMRGAIAKSLEIYSKNSDSYFMPRQFENLANPEIHAKTTAEEIWHDLQGSVDSVVSGVGTGGSITGIGRALKLRNPQIQMVAVEPNESAVLSGEKSGPHKIQGIGPGFVPPILDRTVIDRVERVSSEEALTVARKVIQTEGIPVGISSGAAITAALRIAAEPTSAEKNIVVIIPSYSERYLSTLLAEKERTIAANLSVESVDDAFLKEVPIQT